ncbi:unnamed protein product [Musa acuminata subsp. malaccensis]|uniref:(wild Malaysian banana) hypothetical protein n=1 Tax=Musa acuminata subsp. malaccensis TaxID=214687 RepID=A0A804KQE8_MUSAM|nr:unnamed protein product [Musa acuminata subsp. malaccensis]
MTGQLRSGADSFPSSVCMGRRSADLRCFAGFLFLL